MSRVEELVEEAKRLSDAEQRALVFELERLVGRRGSSARQAPARQASFLDLIGMLEVEAEDVSSNKYRHLGQIYAAER